MASPDPKRQQQEQQQQAPPEYAPFEEEPEQKHKKVNGSNAQALQALLNNLKNDVWDLFSKTSPSTISAAYYSSYFTQNFLATLALYRGELAKFYLDEAGWEMIFSALGPLGDAFRFSYEKNIQGKMAWLKNPLNPNALYYYLQSLPTQMAYKVLFVPAKAAFGILARTGTPLISRVVYQNNQTGKVEKKFVFSPLLRLNQLTDKWADKIDAKSGVSTNELYRGYEQFLERKNQDFRSAINELRKAKAMGNPARIFGAETKIKELLRQYDGNIWQAILRTGRVNTARRLRQHHRDPISYFLSLFGGSIWDIVMTLTVRPIISLATKALNLIPAFRVLRAQMAEFFTSNRYLGTFRIGGITSKTILQGTFSPTTLSHTYLGYNLGSALTPNLFVNGINVGGGILGTVGAGWGAFYTSAVKLANMGPMDIQGRLNPLGWYHRYNELKLNGETKLLEQEFFKTGVARPGPLLKFSDWLARKWLVRLPINGWVAADFLSPTMQRLYGWSPLTTHFVFAGVDYLWQIKGNLSKYLLNKFIQSNFFIRWLDPINPYSITARFYNRFVYRNWLFRQPSAAFFQGNRFVDRPLFSSFKNVLSKIQPYAENLINPGLILGAQLLGPIFQAMGIPWYLAGPLGAVAGSAGWMVSYHVLGGSKLGSLTDFSTKGWWGYGIGVISQWLLGLAGIQVPWWYTAIWSYGLPIITTVPVVSGFLAEAALFLESFAFGIAHAVGISAFAISQAFILTVTIASVSLVAGLVILFGYTLYAGFWVPLLEEAKATQQSSNFYINSACTQTAPNQYNCCSDINLTENAFSSVTYIEHKTDISQTALEIDVHDPQNTIDASRNSQSLNYDKTPITPTSLDPSEYTIKDPQTPIRRASSGGYPFLITDLSTPSNQKQNLKELMAQNQSVLYSMQSFFDILTQMAKDHQRGTTQLLDQYNAQLALLNKQEELVDKIINQLKAGNDVEKIIIFANGYKNNNPVADPCPNPGPACTEDQLPLKQLHDSWDSIIDGYTLALSGYQGQTGSNLQPLIDYFQQEADSLDQQIPSLKDILEKIKKIDMTDEDAAIILGPNFNWYNFNDEVWRLLSTYFPDIFKDNKTFYFIPQGTSYRVCIDMSYTGPIPANPQIVCSTVSYQPNFWSPNTAFAKSCTTFTPQ